MIAKSSADRQAFIILFRLQLRKLAGSASIAVNGFGQVEEDHMKKLSIMAAIGAVAIASPVVANHVAHLNDAFASRGACEVERNALSNDDDWLIDAFPDVFSSEGEVRSFLNRAFPCELNPSDGQWYMVDHRAEVLDSAWFQQRNH